MTPARRILVSILGAAAICVGGCAEEGAGADAGRTDSGLADTGRSDTVAPDSGAADSAGPDTSVEGDSTETEVQDTGETTLDTGEPAATMQVLEVEDGDASGMLARAWGGVMDSAGDTVCWSDVSVAGRTSVSLRYSNGESAGDAVDITFGGMALGSLAIDMCTAGGAWAGDCGDATAEITATGTEALCLTGVGSGWIAALDAVTLRAATGVPVPSCSDGVMNQGEEGLDCGGPCVACAVAPCGGADSAYVPAGYRCIWSDEFGGALGDGQAKGAVDQASWTFQNLDVNGEQQNYTNRECTDPDHTGNWNYCVEGGALTIRARDDGIDCSDGPDADNQPDNPDCALDWNQARAGAGYTSGRLISKHKVSHQYGYIEFSARLPHHNRVPQSGLWPAIWLLGNNIAEGPPPGDTSWPWCGEIDILEWKSPDNHMGWNALWIGADDNLDACSAFPEGGSSVCGPCTGGSCRGVVPNGDRWQWDGWPNFPHTVFHTYGLLWTREAMEFFVDGDKVSTLRLGPAEQEFQQAMHLIVNLAIGGSLGGAVQITDWTTTTLDVDYIRWYQRE